jgi:hypothetical protein
MAAGDPLTELDPRHRRVARRALDEFNEIEASLDERERAWLAEVPLAATIAALDARSDWRKYSWIGPDLEGVLGRADALGGEAWTGRYLRMVVLVLLARTATLAPRLVVPASVDAERVTEYERILDEGSRRPLASRITDDRFRKDLELCRDGLVPVGIFIEEVWPGLPDTVLNACAACNPPLDLVLEKGAHRWLEGHVFQPRTDEFSEEASEHALGLVADLLDANADLAGSFGITWYFDPALATVSPRIAYLHDQALRTGALIVRVGPDPSAVAGATATSKTRRLLYEQGTYTPTNYVGIWLRDPLIRWRRSRVGRGVTSTP